MSIINNPLLLGAPSGGGGGTGGGGINGYQISRSLRFNRADSAHLSRTPSVTSNQRTWTWAGWVKRCSFGPFSYTLFSAGSNFFIRFSDDYEGDIFRIYNSPGCDLQATPKYRDPSAWYHLVFAFDTPRAIAADRVKIYVNGVQVTTFRIAGYPDQDQGLNVNDSGSAHRLGCLNGSDYFSGYMADVHFIDGQALTPSSFGAFDSNNVWQPKAYTGTYGTNGFKLNFSDNSAATAAALGKDTSGNGNNWTPSNLSVAAGSGNDSLVDSPTNYGTDTGAGGEVRGNYATFNPLNLPANLVLSDGSLRLAATSGSASALAFGTVAVSSGKWYWEFDAVSASTGNGPAWGFINTTGTVYATKRASTNLTISSGVTITSSYGNNINGGIVGVALNLDAGTATIYHNNVSCATVSSIPAGNYTVACSADASTDVSVLNAGQRPFAYPAPSGYKALCSTNLPTPTILNGATAMDVKLYTGNGTSPQTISGLGFSPDLVWIKARAVTDGFYRSHQLFDTVREAPNALSTNRTDAEDTSGGYDSDGALTAFTSDGFSVSGGSAVGFSSSPYAAWCWDAGSSTVTNTAGTISSQVRANPSAGFSVVTYTGNFTAGATVGHGLGVAPSFMIVKSRTTTDDWTVYHIANDRTKYMRFTADSPLTQPVWNNTTPTSTVLTLGARDETNRNSANYVAYCFAPVTGYSAFGSYTGNGSTTGDGPFVYTGFRPRWLLIKNTSYNANWVLLDTARAGYNVDNDPLYPNLANVEATTDLVDILSNGFKLRSTDGSVNASSGTYIYAAFAEHPFALARAR